MSDQSSSGSGDTSGNARNNQLMLLPDANVDRSTEIPATLPAQRQRNLQDLLRMCTQVSGQNAGLGEPLDEERRLFLEQALKSLTVDVIEVLMKAIRVLKEAGSLDSDDDPSDCEVALEEILEYVDHVDFANDFHKIGGFSILHSCLNSPHASIRWRTAQLVAELTQNNPYCQHHVLEANLLPVLLSLLDSDPDQVVRVKSLHALSSLVRNNDLALKKFQQHDGFSVLLRALQSDVEKLQVKAAFFLSTLKQPDIRDELLKMGFVELFATMISREVNHTTEHMLAALLALVTDCPAAEAECRRPEFQMRRCLFELLDSCQGKEEYQEVSKHSQDLLALVFEDDVEEDR